MNTYYKFDLQSLENYLYSIGEMYGYDKQGNTYYGSQLEEIKQKNLIVHEFPMKNVLFEYGVLGYIRECPDGTWLAHHCSAEIEIFGFINEFYAVLYLHQLDKFQELDENSGGLPHFPWEQEYDAYGKVSESKKISIDPGIIHSIFKKQLNKFKSIGNTNIFSDLRNEQRKYFFDLISLKNDELLIISSIVDEKEWLILSNYGVHYSIDNIYNSINYLNVLDCLVDTNKIIKRGHSAYSEKIWEIVIIKNDSEKITLNIADNLHTTSTIASSINWASWHINASI